MEPNNLPSNPPFKIGDKVIALKNDWGESKAFKKGDIFVVAGLLMPCKHGWVIDIGLKDDSKNYCKICNVVVKGYDVFGIRYVDARRFALVQPRHQNVEIAEDILNMEVVEERADVLPETVKN